MNTRPQLQKLGAATGRNTPGSPPGSHSSSGAPILAWQVAEGFPSLIYITNHRGGANGPLVYLIEFGVYFSFLIPLWLAGMISLFRSPRLRPIGVASAVPLLLFLFVGKSYYAAGTIPIAMAAGLLAISRIERRRLRVGLKIAVAVASVLEFATFFFPRRPGHTSRSDSCHEAGHRE